MHRLPKSDVTFNIHNMENCICSADKMEIDCFHFYFTYMCMKYFSSLL